MEGIGFRPSGAQGCSHGWSGVTAQRADAEPVEGVTIHRGRPGGAEDATHQLQPFGVDAVAGLDSVIGATPLGFLASLTA